jgi:hypothetical protein
MGSSFCLLACYGGLRHPGFFSFFLDGKLQALKVINFHPVFKDV